MNGTIVQLQMLMMLIMLIVELKSSKKNITKGKKDSHYTLDHLIIFHVYNLIT